MLLATALLVLGQATVAGPDLPRHPCLALEVVSTASPEKSLDRVPTFSPIRDRDLQLRARLRRIEGTHTMYFKVFTPRGYLYQTFAVPFPAPGPERAARRERVHRVTATLPVAGTTIMTSGLYGQWRVEARLDAAPTLCGHPKSFVIRE
jgi:hypothetical protein